MKVPDTTKAIIRDSLKSWMADGQVGIAHIVDDVCKRAAPLIAEEVCRKIEAAFSEESASAKMEAVVGALKWMRDLFDERDTSRQFILGDEALAKAKYRIECALAIHEGRPAPDPPKAATNPEDIPF